jgi:hypothetical protein
MHSVTCLLALGLAAALGLGGLIALEDPGA